VNIFCKLALYYLAAYKEFQKWV